MTNIDLKNTVQEAFAQYAGAVIQSRALVDVRDCVKPSARQIYYAMFTDNYVHSKPFNKTDMKNMYNYKLINITMVPKYISPYTAITSENWDESLRAAILMKDKENAPESPLEKIVTM